MMRQLMKITLLSLGVISMMGLSACQSNTAAPAQSTEQIPHDKSDHPQPPRPDHDGKPMKKMTEQERAKFKQDMEKRHAEHQAQVEAAQKACEGKIGQTISVKIGDKTMEGKCEVQFHPNKPEGELPPPPPAPEHPFAPAASEPAQS